MGRASEGLTDKQEKFVQELLRGKSQREAYKSAYNAKRMKDEAIDVNASKLLADTKVSLRYNSLCDRLAKEAEDECIVSAKDVLRELTKVAFANTTDYVNVIDKEYNDNGVIKQYKAVDIESTDMLPLDKKVAIASIKQGANGIEMKLHDKVKALELIGKHLRMFDDKVELGGDMNLNININYGEDSEYNCLKDDIGGDA